MDNIQAGVVSIIRAALTSDPQVLPPEIDLEQVVNIGRRHGILTLLYYGLKCCGMNNTDPLMQKLFQYAYKGMITHEHQMAEFQDIFAAFDKNGIDYMPLKGTLLKELYPQPEMRPMGDADILIKLDQYETIKPIMTELGFTEKLETDHELVWRKPTAYVELHKRLMSTSNKDFYAYFGDGWRLAKHCVGTRYYMTDEDQLIYLLVHFAKHYRNGGIGIKHMVDLWVYHKNKTALDAEYLKQELEKLSLYDFYVNVMATLGVWFEEQTPTKVTDFITAIIFNSGAFGTREATLLADALKEGKASVSAKEIRTRKWWNAIFLPYKQMCIKYPVLKKFPFLLPGAWIYRIINSALFRKRNVKQQLHQISLMREENISGYQEALNYVGLDFNF